MVAASARSLHSSSTSSHTGPHARCWSALLSRNVMLPGTGSPPIEWVGPQSWIRESPTSAMAPTLAHTDSARHRRSPAADTSRRVLWSDIAGAQRAPGGANLATLLSLLATRFAFAGRKELHAPQQC